MITISIVIATYNRAESLIRSLRSLRCQRLDSALWEIVVVDNNSTDHTSEAARQFIEKTPDINVTLVSETRQGLSWARNKGIEACRGEIIVMVDDDIETDEHFALAYNDFFRSHPEALAAGGKIVPFYDFTPPRWLSKYTEGPIAGTTDFGDEPKLFSAGHFPIGCNMAFRREAVERYGGFDTELGRKGSQTLGGEEKEFFGRMATGGEQIWYVPTAVVHHIIPESRLTKEYFDRVTYGAGQSERIRTKSISQGAFRKRIVAEGVKWAATLALSAGHLITGKPSKAGYLIRMRRNISKGLFGR